GVDIIVLISSIPVRRIASKPKANRADVTGRCGPPNLPRSAHGPVGKSSTLRVFYVLPPPGTRLRVYLCVGAQRLESAGSTPILINRTKLEAKTLTVVLLNGYLE